MFSKFSTSRRENCVEEETTTLTRNADRVDIVLLPPPNELSDVEAINNEKQVPNDQSDLLRQVKAEEIGNCMS